MTDLILELGSGSKLPQCCWHRDPGAEGPVGSPQHPLAAHTPRASGFWGAGGVQPLQKRLWEQHRVLVTHGLGAFPTLSEAVATFLLDP